MAHDPKTRFNGESLTFLDNNIILSDVLQSESVKHLLKLPNVVVRAISLNKSKSNPNRIGNTNKDVVMSERPQSTIVLSETSQWHIVEDENLLPSKIQGKSEVALVPVKRGRKPCGHYEPCEDIICDVTVQQYVDSDGSFPLLAISIEENEINATVSKHCANKRCDALSIDHDRCRRALIKLHRYNQSAVCDICGIALKTLRSRIRHKNCTKKNEYRHNLMSGAEILKERMREREIQMLHDSKVKRNDYMDPVSECSRAIEALRNNKELIIIPKSGPLRQQPQQPAVTENPKTHVAPQNNTVLTETKHSNQNNTNDPLQVVLSNALNKKVVTTDKAQSPQRQYITFTTQTDTYPIELNDLLLPQSQIVTTPIQPKPLVTPMRVVPITNLITPPSLLHQTQGVPKFCIMPDNTVPSLTITNQITAKPTPVPKAQLAVSDSKVTSPRKKKLTPTKKGKLKKKDFKCDYCLKCFSTDWYFKIHVAKHTGGKRFHCKRCAQSFNNKYDLKRHISKNHSRESINSSVCDKQVAGEFHKCLDCNVTFTLLDELCHHRKKCHKGVEMDKANVSSNTVETNVDNLDLQQEVKKNCDKLNGYTRTANQDIVKCAKTELRHEV